MRQGITIIVDDKEFRNVINNDRFIRLLHRNLSRTFLGVGTRAVNVVKQQIQGGKTLPRQGFIQRIIKGHGRTLVMYNRLANAVRFRYVKGKHYRGIDVYVDDTPIDGRMSAAAIAGIMHSGARWSPTPGQRRRLMGKAIATGWKPSGDSPPKPIYEIPKRPFLVKALDKQEVFVSFGSACVRAVDRTINELKRK